MVEDYSFNNSEYQSHKTAKKIVERAFKVLQIYYERMFLAIEDHYVCGS